MKPQSLLLGALLGALALPARAEWDLGLYAGASHTPKSDVTMVIGSATGPADHTFHDVKWDPSTEFGLRGGYWFGWYGVGLDVFRFDADIPMQNVNVTIQGATLPVTLQAIDVAVTAVSLDLVRLRYRAFTSERNPNGLLTPYVTAGPTFFRTSVTNRGNGELTTKTGTDTTMGYKLGAGLSWQMLPSTALFAEYRYTHFSTEPNLQGAITGANVPTRFDLNTHHFIAGLSVSF
jgi:opacity protein-like surface antigen